MHGTHLVNRGIFFEYLPAPTEPSADCFGNAKCLASAPCEPISPNTGRSVASMAESERNTQNFAIPTPRFARKFSTWNPPSRAEGACPQNCMVEQPRNQVSEMHFGKFRNPSTFQFWKRVSRLVYHCAENDYRFDGALLTHLAHSPTSKLSSKRQEGRLFVNSHVRHLTGWEPSY